MTTQPDFGSVRRAVEVLYAPHAQVLAALRDGRQPSAADLHLHHDDLAAAVLRLIELGVVCAVDSPDSRGATEYAPLALTDRGLAVERLVRELASGPDDCSSLNGL